MRKKKNKRRGIRRIAIRGGRGRRRMGRGIRRKTRRRGGRRIRGREIRRNTRIGGERRRIMGR